MKPRVFFKYINDVFKMSEKRDDSIVILSELCELLSEKYDINALGISLRLFPFVD